MSAAAVAGASPTGSTHGLVYVLLMILSGTLNTVFSKMQYGVRSQGTELCVDPADASLLTNVCAFDKPWFSALLAKIGMTMSFVYVCGHYYVTHRASRAKRLATETEITPLVHPLAGRHDEDDGQATTPRLPARTVLAIAWPSLLDLLQTLISNVGLLWVSSSVYQMARGSVIIFSALVSVQFLHKRLYAYHYTSILIVCTAVLLVGWAAMPHRALANTAAEDVADANALLGLSLIVMAQFLTAVQIVAEEYIMNQLHVRPLLLVGIEGLWGLLFYVVLVPVLTLTPTSSSAISKIWHEDFYDSLVKVASSNTQIALSLLNIAAVAALGPSANFVTKHLSGVMRSIAEVLRTLGVWVVGLFVFYIVQWRGVNSPGEAWTAYSWIELAGFVLMVYGTLAYKGIIEIPIRALYSREPTALKQPEAMTIQKPAFA